MILYNFYYILACTPCKHDLRYIFSMRMLYVGELAYVGEQKIALTLIFSIQTVHMPL